MTSTLYNGDCKELLKTLPDGCVDLIMTDPPYQIEQINGGGIMNTIKGFERMNHELQAANLISGFDVAILDEMLRVLRKPNIYVWCNGKQLPMYLDYFVRQNKCVFDIIVWCKTNAVPTFSNKYLTDKEYCLYFRKGGYCNPTSYTSAKTVYFQPINVADKHRYGHPTIKPLNIIQTLIQNSTKEGDTVLDCFMGSGTTGEACVRLNRNFIGMEINENFYRIAQNRIGASKQQQSLF